MSDEDEVGDEDEHPKKNNVAVNADARADDGSDASFVSGDSVGSELDQLHHSSSGNEMATKTESLILSTIPDKKY